MKKGAPLFDLRVYLFKQVRRFFFFKPFFHLMQGAPNVWDHLFSDLGVNDWSCKQ